MFCTHAFSHDSLAECDAAIYGNILKIQLGRWLVPIYRMVFRTHVTLPWVSGFLGLLWLSAALFFICRTFRIKSFWSIFLLSGFLTVNLPMIGLIATYIQDFDQNMFALFLVSASVFLLFNCRHGWLLGILCIILSLGLYQAYFFSCSTMIAIALICRLVQGYKIKYILIKAALAMLMLLCSCVLYLLLSRFVLYVLELPSAEHQFHFDLLAHLLSRIEFCYQWTKDILISGYSAYSVFITRNINIILIIVSEYFLLVHFKKQSDIRNKILATVLFCALPLAFYPLLFVSNEGHTLMFYSYWLLYLLEIWLIFRKIRFTSHWITGLVSILMLCLIWGNVLTANSAYLKKRFLADAYLSYMTRVNDRIQTFPCYIPGKTPVVFVGTAPYLCCSIATGTTIVGLDNGQIGAHHVDYYRAYFRFFLHSSVYVADWSVFHHYNADPRFANMPVFPHKDSMKMVDGGVLVVKLR